MKGCITDPSAEKKEKGKWTMVDEEGEVHELFGRTSPSSDPPDGYEREQDRVGMYLSLRRPSEEEDVDGTPLSDTVAARDEWTTMGE